MTWPKCAFGSLFAVPSKNGLTRPARVRGSGIKMINMGELFANDRIGAIDMELVPVSDRDTETMLVEQGDLLFARQSLVLAGAGKCSIVQKVEEPTTFESHIIRVRLDGRRANPAFYHQYFKSPSCGIRSIVTQGVQAGIRGSDLNRLAVAVPPLDVQDRIADRLSRYDDLIENNRRRIQLLEESARLLYREWFVHLRFPGHERVRVVDGVPKGWERKTLTEVCASLEDGDWIESKDQGGDDYRLLQISNIGINEFVETGNFRFINEETFRRLRCRELLPGHILISRMPKPIGRAWLVTDMPWKMITAVDGAILVPDSGLADPHFLIQFLNSEQNLALCERLATGATRPRIARRELASLPVLVPPGELQRAFREVAEPLNLQRSALQKQNEKLAQARDLLLPRLMSGEITV